MRRIPSLDLARGFTVLCIAPIHVLLIYGSPSIYNSLVAKMLAFIAEWHGAQIFMLIMGIAITLKEPQPVRIILRRACMLLVAAYCLNACKFVIPWFLHNLPAALLNELNIDPAAQPMLHLFLIGDILHFAAIAFLISSLVYRHPKYPRIALYGALTVCLISPFFYDAASNNGLVNYFLQLFAGRPPNVFFPVLPWLVYPLLGLWIGVQLKKERPLFGFDSFWLAGIIILLVALPLKYFLDDHSFSVFYRTNRLDTCIHVSLILMFLSAWHWLAGNVRPNALFKLFRYCSRHITLIYLIQWVLICWAIPIFGFRNLGFWKSMFAMSVMCFLTITLSLLFQMILTKPIKPKS